MNHNYWQLKSKSLNNDLIFYNLPSLGSVWMNNWDSISTYIQIIRWDSIKLMENFVESLAKPYPKKLYIIEEKHHKKTLCDITEHVRMIKDQHIASLVFSS